jgi:hypothetical protein
MKRIMSIKSVGKKYRGLAAGGYRDMYEITYDDGSKIETEDPCKYTNGPIILSTRADSAAQRL